MRRGSSVLLVAPMGWGKTRVALAVVEALRRRAVVLTSRLGIVAKFAEEARSAGFSMRLIATAGAGELCALGLQRPWMWCRRCELRRDVRVELPSVATWVDVASAAPEDACPYHAQRVAEQGFDVVVAHYGRWPSLQRLAELVVVDEAHNLYMPVLTSMPLEKWREVAVSLFGRDVQPSEARELLASIEPKTPEEARLMAEVLSIARARAIVVEEGEVVAADVYPRPRFALAMTATPPSGLKADEVVEVEAPAKARAYLFDVDTSLEALRSSEAPLIVRAFARTGAVVFATRRQLEALGVEGFEAWGRAAEGVDVNADAAVVVYPRLHPVIRRLLRAHGVDPDEAECIRGVQLAGRILRPLERVSQKTVAFVGRGFKRCLKLIERWFELQ